MNIILITPLNLSMLHINLYLTKTGPSGLDICPTISQDVKLSLAFQPKKKK